MSGPDPAVAAVRVAVRRVLTQVPSGGLVLAACSGGADSVALLAGLAWEAPRAGVRAGVVHVDHGLATGSAAVATSVLQLGRDLGVNVAENVAIVVDAAAGMGPEAAARKARYAALAQTVALTQASLVLLGHTVDDQAETVLLGLARGSGARSLAGMPAQRDVFARPLLGLRRADTEQCCKALGLSVWDDPSNADQAFARNRVRAVVLPALERELGPGIAAALARSAELLRDDADALDAAAAAAYTGLAVIADVAVELPVAALQELPAAVRRRVILRAAAAIGVPTSALGSVHLAAAQRLIDEWHGQGPVSLPGGFACTRRYASLQLAPAPTLRE